MNNNIIISNPRIIYPDFMGSGMYNKYNRSLFNIIVDEREAAMMAQSGIRVKKTKPTQNFPVEEFYVEITISFRFLNRDTGEMEPVSNPPVIVLHDLAESKDIIITEETIDVLASAKLSNITISLTQSTPKLDFKGNLSSRFYLKEMEANMVPFYAAPNQ